MTSQPEPVSRDASQANQITNPLREPAALVLLSANALLLLVGLIDLLVPISGGASFSGRAADAFFNFAGLAAVLLPLVAVLISTHVSPPVRRAKLITRVALGEYLVAAVFALLAVIGWLAGGLADAAFRNAFNGLLTRIAYCAILAIAAFVVFKIWRTFYYRPRRLARPGSYGKPGLYGKPANPPSGLPDGYPEPPAFDPESGYGSGHTQPPAVPTQPASSRAESGGPSEAEETQVLNRPDDQSGDVAATQRFEPVESERDSADTRDSVDTGEQGDAPKTPKR